MTNYGNGVRFEYEMMKFYVAHGYFVMRSAGSHSPVDLIAFKVVDGRMVGYLIQCKKEKRRGSYVEDIGALRAVEVGDGWKRLLLVRRRKEILVWEVCEDGVRGFHCDLKGEKECLLM
jgi:Holliday junction resolvase